MTDTISTKLRRLRQERKLTQEEVAEALEVGRSTLAGIELGKQAPSRELLFKLAAFYGVKADDLYSREALAIPDAAERVKDADEAALLMFWRSLDEAAKRRLLLRLIRPNGLD